MVLNHHLIVLVVRGGGNGVEVDWESVIDAVPSDHDFVCRPFRARNRREAHWRAVDDFDDSPVEEEDG